MSLIIEDGSRVTGAQSYVSVTFLQTFAATHGASIPSDAPSCEVLLLKAMDYLESRTFVGDKLSKAQALMWPRYGAFVDDWYILTNEIPIRLQNAQCLLAIAAQTQDLQPTVAPNQSGPITKKSVAGIEIDYAVSASQSVRPRVLSAEAMLGGLIRPRGILVTRG